MGESSMRIIETVRRAGGILGACFAAWMATGCAHESEVKWTRAAFEAQVKAFEGKPVTAVVDELGYPQRQFKNIAGEAVYEYDFYNSIREPLYAYTNFPDWGMASPVVVRGGEPYVYGCTIWLDIAGETVKRTRFRGNACRAPEDEKAPSPH